MWRQWPPAWLIVVIIVSVLVSALAVVVVFSDGILTGIEQAKDRADIVRNLGLVVGGIVALGIAIWRSKAAQDQVAVSERDRLDRRFRSGVELLSGKEVVSRLAGIRTLGQLAKHEPELYRDDVIRVLCEFARNPTVVDEAARESLTSLPRLLEDGDAGDEIADDGLLAAVNESIREEIEAAIRVVSDCNSTSPDARSQTPLTINLAGLTLYEANFNDINLSGADLEGSRLVGVDFSGANLSGANLSSANLTAANLTQADLIGANLSVANLQHAQLDWSNLSQSRLHGAVLTGIRVRHSNFSGAFFYPASVSLDTANTVDVGEEIAVIGLSQSVVDAMWAEDDDPPLVDGVLDAETGQAIRWDGGATLPDPYTSWPRS